MSSFSVYGRIQEISENKGVEAMQNWRKNRNFRKIENADGSFTYIITEDGVKVEVSEEVYNAYAQSGYKMENMELGIKNDRVLQDVDGRAVRDEHGKPIILPEREISLDKLIGEDWDFPSAEPAPEEAVLKKLEVEALLHCLDLLDANERALIDALFFYGLTEQEYADLIGVTQKTVNNRKHRILGKMKNSF